VRRRILVAIVSVTAIATTVLTVPLAVITFHRETDDAFRELQRASERTSAGLPDAPGVDGEPIRFPDIPSDIRIAVYSPDGAKIAGTGPETADAVTREAIVQSALLSAQLASPVRWKHCLLTLQAQGVTDYVEPRALVLILLVAACTWAFVQLANEVREGEATSFDTAILLGLRNPADPSDPLGPGWVEEVARDITALGSMAILVGITLASAGYLWLAGKRRSVALVLASVGGGIAVSTLFKRGFDRPRPDLVPHATEVYTASFPSGHAMMAAVTYLTLGALVARVQPTRALKLYVLTLAVIVTVSGITLLTVPPWIVPIVITPGSRGFNRRLTTCWMALMTWAARAIGSMVVCGRAA